jgi:tetratricopeptide (TPR) repeat protein
MARAAILAVVLIGILSAWWWERRSEVVAGRGTTGGPAQMADKVGPSSDLLSEAPEPQAEAEALKREAVTVAKQVVETYPNDALSYALLGSAHYNAGHSEEATRHLRRCLELNPEQAEAYEILARVAYEKGELEEAVGLNQASLKRSPGNVEVLNQLGRALMDLGRTEEAIRVLDQAVRLPKPTSESYYLLGQASLQSGDHAHAKERFERATVLRPGHTQAYFGLYTACMRLGQSEEAKRYRERFLALEADDRQHLTDRSVRDDTLTGLPLVRKTMARTFFGAGQMYRVHGEVRKAADLFGRAAQLDPDAPAYRAMIEASYVQLNAAAEGVKVFEQLAAAQPRNELNHYFLGRLQERLERFEPAEAAYRKVHELAPDWPEGHRALAELYLRANRKPAEAQALARRAVELEPSGAHYALLALAYSRNNNRTGALEAIEQAILKNPNEARYRAMLEQLKGAL